MVKKKKKLLFMKDADTVSADIYNATKYLYFK